VNQTQIAGTREIVTHGEVLLPSPGESQDQGHPESQTARAEGHHPQEGAREEDGGEEDASQEGPTLPDLWKGKTMSLLWLLVIIVVVALVVFAVTNRRGPRV
jgi:hypothetical protein